MACLWLDVRSDDVMSVTIKHLGAIYQQPDAQD